MSHKPKCTWSEPDRCSCGYIQSFPSVRAATAEIIRLSAELEQAEGSLPEAVCEAYGWLWHVETDDKKVHRARRLLLSAMTKPQQRLGITVAREKGATCEEPI